MFDNLLIQTVFKCIISCEKGYYNIMIEFAKEEREKIYSFLSELGFEHMQKE
jgi:hypothetical protein